jgi:predicted AAA+ superfamily ATPase
MYQRAIKNHIINTLELGKIAIIYGTRQVGKTTLNNQIVEYYKTEKNYTDVDILQVNGDFLDSQRNLSVQELKPLMDFIGNCKLLIIDEAQRITNIGINLKIIFDNRPDLKIIATGSSSFELANKLNEPLTGRNIKFTLYPLSFLELTQKERVFDLKQDLDKLLIYGTYPGLYTSPTINDKILFLKNLTSDYLYKDILQWENLKKPELLTKILEYLALQIGSTVSYNNIANNLNTNPRTVEKYIELLEQTFVIFRLRAFSRNRNNELTKSFKVYFWDLGIRNTLIERFNKLKQRDDVGALWENFCIVERIKYNQQNQKYGNYYFWRNLAQNEIDFVEDYDGHLHGFEFKYDKQNILKGSYNFVKKYENSTLELINKNNIDKFLLFLS